MAERPEVTVHFAQTLDGHIDRPASRESAVISNDEGFALAHERRASHDAVLVGIRTVLKDDPRLKVTRVSGNNPHRIVLDSRLRTPTQARLLERTGSERVVIFARSDHGAPAELAALRARGAEVVLLERAASGLLDLSKQLTGTPDQAARDACWELGAAVAAHLL